MGKKGISIMLILCLISLVFILSVLSFESIIPNTANVYSLYSQKQTIQTDYAFETQKISKAKTIKISIEEKDKQNYEEDNIIYSSTRTTKDLSSASIQVNSQTGNLNITKDEFFNFSINVECTATNCNNLILTLDPFENFTPKEIQAAQIELDKIKEDIKDKGLNWTPKLTDVFIEYVTNKNNGKLEYNEPEIINTRTIKSAVNQKDESIIPYFFDWRNAYGKNWVTTTKNQGSCNGCWAFAATSVSEAALNIYNKWPSLQLNLSEQDVITNSGGGTCTSGGSDNVALFYIRDTGIVDEECFSFQGVDIGTGKCSNGYQYNVGNIITIVQDGPGSVNKETAIRNLIKYGPATAQVRAYTDFATYSGGIYEPSTSNNIGAHIITVVGYNETEDYFIIKNSWGSGWGMNGFAYVKSWFILNDPEIFNRLRYLDNAEKLDKGIIPMNSGEPFYTTTQNPYDCGNLTLGETCNVTWEVNATGFHDSNWDFFVIVDMDNGVEKFNTNTSIIKIIGDNIPEIQTIECEIDNAWKNCNLTMEGDTITKIRTNITDENIQNVNIRLKENNTLIKQGSATQENGFYIFNSNYTINNQNLHKIEVDITDESYFINGQIKFNALVYVPDTSAPIVKLISNENDTDGNITLTYNVTDNKQGILNCSIYSNTSGIWQIDTIQSVANNSINNYSYTGLTDGIYNWNVKCSDGNNSAFAPTNETFIIIIPDTIKPVISNINVNNITDEYAKLNWNTNEIANSSINYGLTSALGTIIDSNLWVTSHSLNLYSLIADTLYYYEVTSCDSSGNCESQGPFTFNTLPEIDDPAIWNLLYNKNINEDSLGGIIYPNLKNECLDVDSPINMVITSTHNNFDLFFNGNNLEINNLKYNWHGTETVELDCNGITNSFDLTINPIPDCVTVCTFGDCKTYCE